MSGRLMLRGAVLLYVGLLLALPLGTVVWRTFAPGLGAFVEAVTSPTALHALWLTLVTTAVAVPVCAVLGVACAIALTRHRFPGRGLLNAAVDLPFALSPVVIGLALVLLFGREGWFGAFLTGRDLQIIYALPGMVLATVLVALPFVIREVAPVLEELGTEQEQAAATLGASPMQTFRRVTLPSIRTAVSYGVVLSTARALGEFGAVSVVSGHLVGRTETLTLHVEERFQAFDLAGAYAAAFVLAALAVATVVAMRLLAPRRTDP